MEKDPKPDAETETVACCLCGGTGQKVMRSFGALRLVRCGCGLVFFSPRHTEERLRRIYSQDRLNQLESNAGYFEEDVEEFGRRLKLAEKYVKPSSVLDVGCSTGTFLVSCQRRGYGRGAGVDLNEKTNEYCREKLGLDVSCAFPQGRFDLIHMSDVIEHLPDPAGYLLSLRESLSDGGLLMLTTPNIGNPLNYVLNVKPEEHLYYFSKATIRALLSNAGYEVLEVRSWNRYHSLKNVVDTTTADRIRWLLKAAIALRMDWLVNALVLRNLYTDILVLARKRKA
jgi:2-polyprenyl-3-methyl-5-hydroxy-6-metoxy-1,4-benzoquinol methylase